LKPKPATLEPLIADAIRLLDTPGFADALWHVFRCVCLPDNLAILIYRDTGPAEIIHTCAGQAQVFAALRNTYTSGAYVLDPYHDLHLQAAPVGVYRLRDIAPDAFNRSRYFIEYYEQTTLIDELAFVIYPVEGISLNICLGRDQSSGQQFSHRQIEACQRILPIITALVERNWSGLKTRSGPADDVAGNLVRAVFATHMIRLSLRQAEVALLILKGHSSASAALRLGLSPQTIKVFRRQLYAKCGISSQAELFAMMLPLLKGSS
jgi:DNA-binding CsgD family transcriptional regulator